MNRDHIKKAVHYHVKLIPIACRLDERNGELLSIDDDWIIQPLSDDGVPIFNVRTSHTVTLGYDHIHHFTTNPDGFLGGIKCGFLTLNVQVFLSGSGCWVRPNARPGEPLKPPRVEIVEKWVDLNYPSKSGILQKLAAAGYRVAWCLDTKLAGKVDLEGWESVIEPDPRGVLSTYHLKDRPTDQTLIKKRV